MGKILSIIENHSGGKCFYCDRITLDHLVFQEYQDNEEEFKGDRIFETENKGGKNIKINTSDDNYSLFKYFLDGARRTYKIVDFATTDNKFLPIVAGQIGTAVCLRENKKLRKYQLKKKNVIALPDRLGGEFDAIQNELSALKFHNLSIDKLVKYRYQANPDRPFENLAIAKIQLEMLNMEIELIGEMVHSEMLKTDQMLIIDGSLQFSSIKEDNEYIMRDVIGISKTFNPHLQGILKTKSKEIGHHLINLDFGERTPVFVYETKKEKSNKYLKIGAWYLRIREKRFSPNPLSGIIKIERIATTAKEKEDGFNTDLIDEISRAIFLERNVTCYGNDDRWANHLYPIYLTERFLKTTFVSDQYFLNIF